MSGWVDHREWCERLGLRAVGTRALTAGRSGSEVARVELADGRDVVVKVTTDPARLDAAGRELDLLRHLGTGPERCAPTFVAGVRRPDGVAVALARCAPLAASRRLGVATWVEVATSLARLHSPAHAGAAARTSGARATHDHLPRVLEHGDCHLDNLVRDDDGRVLLVDWQDARLGSGLRDLVFCWQRAEFAGGRPPREAMARAYSATRGLDAAALAPLLDAVELQLLREEWPPYLAWGTDAGRAMMALRLAVLDGSAQEERR